MKLNSDQLDALTETVNIGVGRVGAALSELAGAKVLLHVPSVKVFRLDSLLMTEQPGQEDTLASVKQDFRGSLDGQAILVFPRESAQCLAGLLAERSFLEDTVIDDDCQGVLVEVGNILLNAVLGSMANMVSMQLFYEVPVFAEFSFSKILRGFAESAEDSDNSYVLQAEASFQVSGQRISGQILVYCKLESLDQLLNALITAR